ncbi:MAG: hypothetical protein F6K42_22275 [Leptolyngbya sp. SIO1D8]|nr:hypothetical protein [Leptolyngbya sp. SIO1D8]
MSLSPGTALQNGHYVIDALIEAAPNGDLYWGTHVVTGTQVYLQVLPLNKAADSSEITSLIACLQGLLFSPQSPLPNPFQIFTEGDKTLYVVIGRTSGLPWLHACRIQAPMPTKQALKSIRDVAKGVILLQEKGLSEVDLSPNRVWVTPEGDRFTLTGLPQAHLSQPQKGGNAIAPTSTLQFLAQLLYSFLSGELPPTGKRETLRSTLQERLPNLSPLIAQAICTAISNPNTVTTKADIQQWLATLPDTPTTLPAETTTTPPTTTAQPSSRSRRWGFYPALGLTAMLAAIGGGTLGTAWRLHASNEAGIIQFDPDQSFPAQADWPGDTPNVTFETPYVPEEANFGVREQWVEPEWNNTGQPEESPIPIVSEELEEPETSDELLEGNPLDWQTPFENNPRVHSPEGIGNLNNGEFADEAPLGGVTVPEIVPKPLPSEDNKVLSEIAEPAPMGLPEGELTPAPAPETTSES